MEKQLIRDIYTQAVAENCGCDKFNQDANGMASGILSKIVDNAGEAIRGTTINFDTCSFSSRCIRYQAIVVRLVVDKVSKSVDSVERKGFVVTFYV